ncbi:tyrosine-type recombinase/integrase [Paraburkholderia mimosarum]|uniref:tyrosine-type recombinase/integrase n=1 Tax=Paraburkholderia mimosarum TaxID=312026 RepID=UPI000684C118|nr:site-specific integrase [Paraburkholderia mimosarum]
MEPAQSFLWDLITSNGRVSSPKSWDSYGRALYDFFAFVFANGLDWHQPGSAGIPSALEAYRDWSKGTVGLANTTINNRLRVVVRFYQWAEKKRHIDHLPFELVSIQTSRQPGFLAHVDTTDGKVKSPNILLKQQKQFIKILTREQVKVCYDALPNLTHRLMFSLMLRTGLRQIECRSWPDKPEYVFDPSRRRDLRSNQKIRLYLDPRDMEIKNNTPRSIDMPFELMEELDTYSVRHRQMRERNHRNGEKFPTLFLTEHGTPYTKAALTAIFASLSRRVGFHVTAHMLRHSYATFLLCSLRKSKTFEGEPLLYVRDRMGHSDVTTTAIYLHLINSLEGHLVLAHEDEIDQLFSGAGP